MLSYMSYAVLLLDCNYHIIQRYAIIYYTLYAIGMLSSVFRSPTISVYTIWESAIYIYIYIFKYTYIYIYISIYLSISLSLSIYIYIYIYIYVYTWPRQAVRAYRGKLLHTRNNKSEIPSENATEHTLEHSSNNSLDK